MKNVTALKKKIIVFSLLTSLSIFLSNANAFWFESTERKITTDPSEQIRPSISGAVVIWTDYRNGNTDIYLYNLETGEEVRVTDDQINHYLNDIDGEIAVFTAYLRDVANEEIYAYNVVSGALQNLTNHPADQRNPSIDGNMVVFQDDRNRLGEDLYDLYTIDLSSGKMLPLVVGKGTQVNPEINGNIVVWEDLRNGKDLDVYMANLNTGEEQLVAGGPGNQRYPHVSGDIIVFNNGFHDIWAYRISTGETFAITNTEAEERIPVI